MLTSLGVLVASLVLGQATAPSPSLCDADLGAWLECNNPIAIRYLKTLTSKDVGKALAGVKLSDGSFMARGYRLVALPKGLGRGVHVVLVQRPNAPPGVVPAPDDFPPGGDGAFVWVDRGGDPLPLPDCHSPAYESAVGLSGDVYTWKAAQPEHGVVEVGCVDPGWK